MKLSTKNACRGLLFVMPMVLGCLILYAVPFGLVVGNGASWGVGNMRQWVGLDNFRRLFDNALFLLAMKNTVRFLLTGIPLLLVLSFFIALLLKRYALRFRLLRSVLLLPYVLPVVGAVILVEAVFSEAGFLNEMLLALGIPVQNWLDSGHAFWAAMLLFLWKNTGYGVILLLAGLNTIGEDQYDAAKLDGATNAQQMTYITMPQMWYSIYFCAVFTLINAFKCFREIFLLGGNHPHDSIYMLQHFIQNTFQNLNYPKLAGASIVLFLLMTVVFALCYRWVLKKEAFRE